MVGQEGEGELKKEYQGNLSKEERIKQAEEKIKAARKRREEDKKVNDFEMEKNRILN
jgi:20S proteasome alpha/beta subunit